MHISFGGSCLYILNHQLGKKIHVRVAILNLLFTYLEACIRNKVKQTLVDVISYNIIESYVSPAELSTTNFALNVTVYGLEKSITLSQKKTFPEWLASFA